MNLPDKMRNFFSSHPGDAAGLCAGLALLLLAAVFISGGGMARVDGFFALSGIAPGSQTANVFPCSYFGDCAQPTQTHYGLGANVTTISSPGLPVTLTWTAYSDSSGARLNSCFKNYDGDHRCSLTSVGDVGADCQDGSDADGNYLACANAGPGGGSPQGTAVVRPAVTATYSFCANKYFGRTPAGSYAMLSYPTPCPSVTITVIQPPPASCQNGLAYATYGPSCACPSGQVQAGASCITPAPACTPDAWTCGAWGSCSAAGAQGRTCANSGTCNTVPPPAASQSCTPPATAIPTTLESFTANPSTIQSGSATTLAWTGSKGTNYLACDLAGGQWDEGTWFSALPGSIATNPLFSDTTYSMNCFDTDGSSTGWKSASVTVTPPEEVDVCSNIPGVQTGIPANAHSDSGACVPDAGYQPDPSDPAHFIPVASCPGAHQTGTPPNCTCEVGYQWQGSACVQVMCPGANEANWPACTCAAGFSRDAATSMCIRESVLNIKVNGQDAVRVRKGASVVVTWSTSGVVAESCSVKTNTGTTIGSTDSGTASPAVGNQTTYRLSCTNEAGSVVSKDANATLIPDVIEQ